MKQKSPDIQKKEEKQKKQQNERKLWLEMSKNTIQMWKKEILKQFTCNFYRWLSFSFRVVLWILVSDFISFFFVFIVLLCVGLAAYSNSNFIYYFSLLLWVLLLLLDTIWPQTFEVFAIHGLFIILLANCYHQYLWCRLCNFYLLLFRLSSLLHPKKIEKVNWIEYK